MVKVAASVSLLFTLAACSSPPKPGTPEYALQQPEIQVEKTRTAADQTPGKVSGKQKDFITETAGGPLRWSITPPARS